MIMRVLAFVFAVLFAYPILAQDWRHMLAPQNETEGAIVPLIELSLPPMTRIQVKVLLSQGLGKLVVQDEAGIVIELFYSEPIKQEKRLKVGETVQFSGYYDGKMFWAKEYQKVEE